MRTSPWLVLAVFLLAYNIEFRGVPASSAYLGFVILAVRARFSPLPIRDREVLMLLGGSGLLAAWSVVIWVGGGRFDVVLRAQYLLMFGVIAGVLLAIAAGRSWSVALRAMAYAAAAQGAAVLCTYVFEPARTVISRFLVTSGNISLTYGGRPSGFTNSSGSLLAVTQSVGACAGLMWLWSIERHSTRKRQRRLVVVSVVSCVGSSLLAGRAGAIVLIIFLLARSLEYPKLVAAGVALVGVGVVALVTLPSVLPESSDFYAQASDSRQIILDLLKLWRGQFFDVYRAMPWPRIDANLMAGDPAYFAPDRPTHDAGVVQTLGSLGLPGALIAYLPIVWLACQRRDTRVAGWGLLCWIVLLLEWKEPFIFKGPNLAFIVALALCPNVWTATTSVPLASRSRNRAELGRPPLNDAVDTVVVGASA